MAGLEDVGRALTPWARRQFNQIQNDLMWRGRCEGEAKVLPALTPVDASAAGWASDSPDTLLWRLGTADLRGSREAD